MPKDRPIRNPDLSPAGLSRDELARHRPPDPANPAAPSSQTDTCRFVSSQGGVTRCRRKVSLAGFCRFHHGCLQRGEISPLGRILDVVKDQRRRREINLHGMRLRRLERIADDPLARKS